MRSPRALLLATASLLLAACREESPLPPTAPPEAPPTAACDDPGVRGVVEQLGERMKRVPLLAADSVLARALRETYGPLVTPALLAAWTAAPALAPGRDVSSPWPERIEVSSIDPDPAGGCHVTGEVVYVTSAELASGGSAARVPVVLRVVEDEGWRVASYETRTDGTADPAPAAPDTLASGAPVEENPERTADPDSPEGAAGVVRRYVEVPVTVRAVTRGGTEQRFGGTYVLRRTVVDDAAQAQRRWHLSDATIARLR